jgi:hypothetical protein
MPKTIGEWAVVAEVGEEARELAAPAADARSFAESLVRAGHHVDAVRLLAHLLPRRESVLWAWACAKKSGLPATPPTAASLAATEKWIAQPNDENRRAAMAAAQEADTATPAGAAGLAAFLSGGSLAPPPAPAVPPAEWLAAKAVAASVMLSAISVEPEKAGAKYSEFLMMGFEVAQRIHLWERLSAPEGTEN